MRDSLRNEILSTARTYERTRAVSGIPRLNSDWMANVRAQEITSNEWTAGPSRNEKYRRGTKTRGEAREERTKRIWMMSPIFNESRARARARQRPRGWRQRGKEKKRARAYAAAAAAFVSRGSSRPQNHPVTPQGTREKNPNNRWSKNIAGKLSRPFNCTPKHKAYWFPGRIFPLFFRSTPIPCFPPSCRVHFADYFLSSTAALSSPSRRDFGRNL